DVVEPGSTAVHAQLAAGGQNHVGELFSGELAALIGVDDLGYAVAGEGLLDDFLGVDGLQRDRHAMRQHLAAGHVHHRGQVDKSAGHGNVGRVECPNLIGPADQKIPEQVRVDLV